LIYREIHPRFRDQYGELLEKLEPCEDERSAAVSPRARRRDADPAIGEDLDALLCER